MAPHREEEIVRGTGGAVALMAALGALVLGAAAGGPGLLVGALAGGLVGFIAWI